MRFKPILSVAAIAVFAGAASAHPKLLSASPAPNGTVSGPAHVDLRFSERLMPAFAKADLIMLAMPGMSAMKMPSRVKVGADGKTLSVIPGARLPKGKYLVNWRVVSKDTHKIAGKYVFAVK